MQITDKKEFNYLDSPWILPDGNPMMEIPKGRYYGFVYRITNLISGKMYIGQKTIWSTRKVKLGKRAIEEADDLRIAAGRGGRVTQKKVVTKESDWRTYFGSNEQLNKDVVEHGAQNFIRSVIGLVPTHKLASYLENYYLYSESVLSRPDEYYNGNISGKYYTEEICEYYGVPYTYVRPATSSEPKVRKPRVSKTRKPRNLSKPQ